jgi:hypothetical protein
LFIESAGMSLAKHFGAVGDGKADDTAALQHAVDDGDGVLELSRGTYRITQPIVLDLTQRGYLGVRGDQGTARLVMAGAGPALRVVGGHRGSADPKTVRPATWDRERFPVFSGFEILGEHPEADGIELVRTMQCTVSSVLVRECRHGIHLVERNRNFILTGSHIYRCSDTGLFFDECNLHQVNIFGNHISYNQRAGIRQWKGDVHNIQITGNDIEYNSGHPDITAASGEIVLEAPEGIASEYTIASNTIQATPDARGANLYIAGKPDALPTGGRLIAITGNVIGHREHGIVIENGIRIGVTGNTIYGGTSLNIRLEDCWYAVIGSNTILSNPAEYVDRSRDGLLLERCVGCTIVGNIMNSCHAGDATGGGCVTLRDCREVSVSSCQILDPEHRGIHLHNGTRCRISDNTIADRREKPTMLAAIQVTGAGKDNVVQNNTVSQGAKAAIDCDPALGAVLNNTVWK